MKCALCGEYITHPYFFENRVFGYTCINIVNPLSEKRTHKNEKWVISNNFNTELLENGKLKITAIYNGKKFIDFKMDIINSQGNSVNYKSIDIFIQNNIAYININKFKL